MQETPASCIPESWVWSRKDLAARVPLTAATCPVSSLLGGDVFAHPGSYDGPSPHSLRTGAPMTIPPSVGKLRPREAGRLVLNGPLGQTAPRLSLVTTYRSSFAGIWGQKVEAGGGGDGHHPQSVRGSGPCLPVPRVILQAWGQHLGRMGGQQDDADPQSSHGELQRRPASPTNAIPPGQPPSFCTHLCSFSGPGPCFKSLHISGTAPPHLLCPLDLPQSQLGPSLLCSETCSSSPGPSEMPQPTQHPPDSASPSVNWG